MAVNVAWRPLVARRPPLGALFHKVLHGLNPPDDLVGVPLQPREQLGLLPNNVRTAHVEVLQDGESVGDPETERDYASLISYTLS